MNNLAGLSGLLRRSAHAFVLIPIALAPHLGANPTAPVAPLPQVTLASPTTQTETARPAAEMLEPTPVAPSASSKAVSSDAGVTSQSVTNAPASNATSANAGAPASNSASKLFADPNNPATAQATQWQSSRPADAAIMARIGSTPTAIWLGGWNQDVRADVAHDMSEAASENAEPTFVAYNIPGRDCGSYSAGGATDASSYIAWIKDVSAGVGSSKAMLILEPDGLASISCLSSGQQSDRIAMLKNALGIFKSANPNLRVYVDAGNSGWIDAATMASRLNQVGIGDAAGFALNVSNFFTTAQNEAYGEKVSALTGGTHFVIDTSRNGNGSNNGQWCNPSGMALGEAPTLSTGNPLVDAFLWVKQPGESDGNCNGAPAAGGWWADYALGLAHAAGW